jgi:hypothetical protein
MRATVFEVLSGSAVEAAEEGAPDAPADTMVKAGLLVND